MPAYLSRYAVNVTLAAAAGQHRAQTLAGSRGRRLALVPVATTMGWTAR